MLLHVHFNSNLNWPIYKTNRSVIITIPLCWFRPIVFSLKVIKKRLTKILERLRNTNAYANLVNAKAWEATFTHLHRLADIFTQFDFSNSAFSLFLTPRRLLYHLFCFNFPSDTRPRHWLCACYLLLISVMISTALGYTYWW
jgi:hypothetical protein